MTFKVLVVDDSGFFRRRLSELINSSSHLKMVGSASNGREAIEQTIKLKPDVITMDYEMPVMDGISAVREIMKQCPTPILMFSSLTYEGARVTLDSLDAGAVDYLPKVFEDISNNSAVLKRTLEERLIAVAKSRKVSLTARGASPEAVKVNKPTPAQRPVIGTTVFTPPAVQRVIKRQNPYRLVVIGTSTGGPVALQRVLTELPANYSLPIILIQHMPSTFTRAFAQRLNSLCKITVKEAEDGDMLKPGVALLAPGGKQLMVVKGGRVKVLPGDERLNYRPSVDVAFGSAANVYNDTVLAVVLTGMGTDGCEGAKLLKQKGASVWAQDEDTSVIYGMPMAIAKAKLADKILPLQHVAPRLCGII